MDKGYIREEFIRPADAESLFYKYISERLDDPLEQLELLNQIQYRYRISMVHLSLVDELLDDNQALLDQISDVTGNCE